MAVKGKKNVKIEKTEADQVLTTVKALKAPAVVTELASVQVSIQETLAGLSSQITEKLSIVETLDKGIQLKESRLKELHGIEAAAITIDDTKAQQEALRAEFEEEMTATRAKWAEEVAERRRTVERAEQEYAYQTQLARKKNQDEFDATVAKRNRDETARQELLAKGWSEREATLAAAEKEVEGLRARVANIQTEIDAAVKRETAIVGNSVKRDYEQQLTIANLNSQNEKKLAEQALNAANLQIQTLRTQNEALTVQIREANDRAENIASRAVESASGRQALEAVQKQSETLSQNSGKR